MAEGNVNLPADGGQAAPAAKPPNAARGWRITRSAKLAVRRYRSIVALYKIGAIVIALGGIMAAAIWNPDLGRQPFTLPLFAFLLSMIVALALPAAPRPVADGGRHSRREPLNPGVVWLLCFVAIVGAVQLGRVIDRYAELRRLDRCTEFTQVALREKGEPPADRINVVRCHIRQ